MAANMKQMIFDTFLRLADTKSIDKITVKELVAACGISRQTFYYHFQDILEVIEWGVRQRFEQSFARIMEADSAEAAMGELITVAIAGKPLHQKLLHSQRREQIEHLTIQGAKEYLKRLFLQKAPEATLSHAEQELTIDFLSYGLMGVLLGSDISESTDVEKLAQQICRMLSGEMYHLRRKEEP